MTVGNEFCYQVTTTKICWKFHHNPTSQLTNQLKNANQNYTHANNSKNNKMFDLKLSLMMPKIVS